MIWESSGNRRLEGMFPVWSLDPRWLVEEWSWLTFTWTAESVMLFNTLSCYNWSRNWRLSRCISAIIIIVIMIMIIIMIMTIYFDCLWSPRCFGNFSKYAKFQFLVAEVQNLNFYFRYFISVRLVIFTPETNMELG